MKFSIRFIVLTTFITLLLTVSSLIMGIDYFKTNALLLKTSQKLFRSSSDRILARIYGHLLPVQYRTNLSLSFAKDHLIDVNNQKQMTQYLLGIIRDLPYVRGTYYGNTQGDLFYVERQDDGFLVIHIFGNENNKRETLSSVDNDGNVKKVTHEKKIDFDPRQRPWYQAAVKAKRQIWSNIYAFHTWDSKTNPVFGITSSAPIYSNKDKSLEGVFGMDLTLDSIAEFLSKLKITTNSVTMIIDSDGNTLSSDYVKTKTLGNINDFHIDWAKQSFLENKNKKQNMFFFDYKDKQYLVSFAQYQPEEGKTYYIVITAPVTDILEELRLNVLKTSILTLIILILGLIFIFLFSTKLSAPITYLANKTENIKNLSLTPIRWEKTFIKEIFHMQNAFDAMRTGLTSFARYVPFSLVKDLMSSGEVAHVGGKEKEISIVFSDIHGFTALSETMDPEQLTIYLSEYFEEMTKVLRSYRGTLDKYIGDCLMAFWGAPKTDKKHALHACQCSLSFLSKLKELNEKLKQENKPEIVIRIGINTGKAVVGNVGSCDRLSYTAMGDSVNLASRLQTLCKLYDTFIIVSDSTYQLIKEDFKFRLLDYVAVRGKKQGTYIYELLDDSISKKDLNIYNESFKTAFEDYVNEKWDSSMALFEKLKPLYPTDKVASIFIERCKKLKKKSLANWKGMWIFHD